MWKILGIRFVEETGCLINSLEFYYTMCYFDLIVDNSKMFIKIKRRYSKKYRIFTKDI